MARRDLPLHVFHFDCFWMREFHWCNFEWDPRGFPDPEGMLARLHAKGLKICVWINPYVAQRSPLFDEGMREGYFLKRPNGVTSGRATSGSPAWRIVDFTNPAAWRWYQAPPAPRWWRMGVDCFKTDFGERIPTEGVVYHDGSDPVKMHNLYALLYNKTVFELLREAARATRRWSSRAAPTPAASSSRCTGAATAGRTFESMAESLRGGLSLTRLRLRLLEPRHRRLRGRPAAGASTSAGSRSACCPRTAACTAAAATGCPGWSTRKAATCCASSRS